MDNRERGKTFSDEINKRDANCSNEMIERVAKAIFACEFPGCDWETQTTALGKKLRLDTAKAAIAAMREPTEEMRKVGKANSEAAGFQNIDVVTAGYKQMINAALKK